MKLIYVFTFVFFKHFVLCFSNSIVNFKVMQIVYYVIRSKNEVLCAEAPKEVDQEEILTIKILMID
jgi:hypothetical protein